jgi:hypothetical protein
MIHKRNPESVSMAIRLNFNYNEIYDPQRLPYTGNLLGLCFLYRGGYNTSHHLVSAHWKAIYIHRHTLPIGHLIYPAPFQVT